jgi:16S rRNA (cytosine967-C5)-methyltransferase
VAPARIAAFEILRRVEDDGAYASVLLAADDEEMRPDDRALCYELVMGVLRWQLWLDALISHFANRLAESLDKPVRRALRIGLYELRFLTRIPPSASVNQAVNLAYHARVRSAAGFVNAVLRRATRESEYNPSSEISDPIKRISIATSHPVWLIERWTKAFGFEAAEEFARANNKMPPVAFRLISKSSDEESVLGVLREAGAKVTPSQIAYGAWRVEGANSVVRRLADDGRIYLQDEASQLVAHVLDAKPGDRILDVCAAPGSKTTHIALLAPNAALVVAGDIHAHRLRTVMNTGMRLGARIIAVVHDATAVLPFQDQSFDCVLVDAPCSGTGTLRRNPEIKWRISTEDISDVVVKQKKILANSAVTVKRGGKLVYSTCSFEPDENEDVVEAFLESHDEFIPMPVQTDGLSRGAHGSVRTWPQRDGADGFFIAAFSRSE